jgi:hypothetical protein
MTINITADGAVMKANRASYTNSVTHLAWSLWPATVPYNPWISPDWPTVGKALGDATPDPYWNWLGGEELCWKTADSPMPVRQITAR